MFEVQNHQLLLNNTVISDLPHFPYTTTVTVWRVPESYRASGYFVGIHKAGDPEELPACDLSQCEKLTTLSVEPHPDAVLEALKAQKKAAINAERDARISRPVSALNHTWNADERSKSLIIGAIVNAMNGGPLPKVWRTSDNVDVPITDIKQLLAIAGAIAEHIEAEYQSAWQRKAAVDAAVSQQEIDAA